MDLIAQSFATQVLWLRNHPSIISWMPGSDMLPTPKLEENYLAFLKESDNRIYVGCLLYTSDTGFVSLWKKDILAFKDTPLKDVIEDLERWYNVSFTVEDKRAYIYSYTIVSENVSLEKILKDLEKISPVKFTLDENTVIVSM